jgi:hypothetical protein
MSMGMPNNPFTKRVHGTNTYSTCRAARTGANLAAPTLRLATRATGVGKNVAVNFRWILLYRSS